MRTKIVYVVSSNADDVYLEQALISAYSVRLHQTDATIVLVVDEKTDVMLNGKRGEILKYLDEKVVVHVPEVYNKFQTSRYMKTSLRKHVKGDFLFVDTDTIIAESLEGIDHIEADVAAVINGHLPLEDFSRSGVNNKKRMKRLGAEKVDGIQYFSSGVIFVKDSEVAHAFYKKWHELWKVSQTNYHDNYDQPAFNTANEKIGYIIKEIDGIWNCQILSYGLPYFYKAKIVHYFASKRMHGAKGGYSFHDKKIYSVIKNEGILTDDIQLQIRNCKSSFSNPCKIVNSVEDQFLQSDLAYYFIRYPIILKLFNPLAKFGKIIYRKVIQMRGNKN